MAPRILILAYGNPLRCDDGIAWRAAEALEGKFPESHVQILRLHQLAPELADTLRGCERVIFIDAAFDEEAGIDPGTIRVQEIGPATAELSRFSHSFSPEKVVALGAALYGTRPQAFWVTIQGADFKHGSELSVPVAKALPELVSTVKRLVSDAVGESYTTKDTK